MPYHAPPVADQPGTFPQYAIFITKVQTMSKKKKRKNSNLAGDFNMSLVNPALGGCITREEYLRRQEQKDNKIYVKSHTTVINDVANYKLG